MVNNNKIEDIIKKISPLMDELSEECKSGTFSLINGKFSVKFNKKASEIN